MSLSTLAIYYSVQLGQMVKYCIISQIYLLYFFFNHTATTEIYTLSLHDALPISAARHGHDHFESGIARGGGSCRPGRDRKSTRLNSSHMSISYAVFCLKKKNKVGIINSGNLSVFVDDGPFFIHFVNLSSMVIG